MQFRFIAKNGANPEILFKLKLIVFFKNSGAITTTPEFTITKPAL
jgi:hypothetical protein